MTKYPNTSNLRGGVLLGVIVQGYNFIMEEKSGEQEREGAGCMAPAATKQREINTPDKLMFSFS